MLPAAPPPVASVVAVNESALHNAGAAGAADEGAADGEVLPDGAADVDDCEGEAVGVDELGGALLVPEGLGLGPQAASISSEAAAVVVKSPVLMR